MPNDHEEHDCIDTGCIVDAAEKIKSLNDSLSEVDRILDKMESGEETGILVEIATEGDMRTIRVPPCCVSTVSAAILAQLTESRGDIIKDIQLTAEELSSTLQKNGGEDEAPE